MRSTRRLASVAVPSLRAEARPTSSKTTVVGASRLFTRGPGRATPAAAALARNSANVRPGVCGMPGAMAAAVPSTARGRALWAPPPARNAGTPRLMLGLLGLGWFWKREEDPLLAEHGIHMVDRDDIKEIATLVNDLIDMEFFDECEEQAIFEDAVCQVVKCVQDKLPKEYQKLIHHDSHLASLTSQATPKQDREIRGIDEELADTIVARMMPYVVCHVKLPHLGKTDERRVISCVVEILVHSMRADRVLWQFCSGDHAHDLIVNVFMKGSIGKLFDVEERKKVIDTLLANVKNVPFVPITMLESLAEFMIDWVASHIECALTESYWQKHDDHVNTLAQLPDPTSGAPGAGATDEALVLQTMMMETSETYHVSHYICENLTARLQGSIAPIKAPDFIDWAVHGFLDLGILEMDKLEEIWANPPGSNRG